MNIKEVTRDPILHFNTLALYGNGIAEGVPKSKIGVVGKELDEADGGCTVRATFQITLDCKGQSATEDHQDDKANLDIGMRIF